MQVLVHVVVFHWNTLTIDLHC